MDERCRGDPVDERWDDAEPADDKPDAAAVRWTAKRTSAVHEQEVAAWMMAVAGASPSSLSTHFRLVP